MIVKVLSFIVLVHTAFSKPQFNFGGLGGLLPGNAANTPSIGLGGLGFPGLSITLPNLGPGLGINLGFGDFKSLFNKVYANPAEESSRQQIYIQNQKIVADHNILFDQRIETYSLAINYFADWTHDEYLAIQGVDLSLVPDNDAGSRKKRQTRASDTCTSPDSKDWRKDGAVSPVKNQEKCASCWAFSAAGALEAQFFIKNGVVNSLSEQQFIDCSKNGNKGCNKGLMNNAFQYTQNDGIVTEDQYPYEAKDGNCRATPSSMKVGGVESIPKGDEKKLQDAVCRIGPIAAALDASDEKFKFYHDGVYYNKKCNPKKTTHAVLVIGYDYDESTQLYYWLIKNSYGTTWGKEGYGKVARNEKNHCGIANLASYPIVN